MWSLCFLVAILIALWAVVAGISRLIRRRPRAASSAFAAVLLFVAGWYVGWATLPLYVRWNQDRAFAAHRASYEHTVEEWKARGPSQTPFRLVVDGIDQSGFLMGSFDCIVYDESDAIGADPDAFSGIWPCAIPNWETKKFYAFEEGRKSSRPLGNHFYFVNETEP